MIEQLVETRSSSFKEKRHKRSMEAAEDYTELILDLIEAKGEARVCDIAREMGISHVTVLKTIKRLEKAGFLKTENHKPVELTKSGQELASFCKHRHLTLMKFLEKIGVPQDVIAADIEGIEHYISSLTLQAIETYMEKHLIGEIIL